MTKWKRCPMGSRSGCTLATCPDCLRLHQAAALQAECPEAAETLRAEAARHVETDHLLELIRRVTAEVNVATHDWTNRALRKVLNTIAERLPRPRAEHPKTERAA